jgi:hypothetical protein
VTEEQIRAIARDTGFSILESPVWAQLAQRFITELLQQIEQEKTNV